jgi:hypothetical protein
MGWASGSRLFGEIIEILQEHITDKNIRRDLYVDLIEAFEESDWDTQDECSGADVAFDEAMEVVHPEWYDDR